MAKKPHQPGCLCGDCLKERYWRCRHMANTAWSGLERQSYNDAAEKILQQFSLLGMAQPLECLDEQKVRQA